MDDKEFCGQTSNNLGISQIIVNMIGLYYFGTRIANTLGPRYLLKLYFAGALGSSVVFLSQHALMTTTFKSIVQSNDKTTKGKTNPIIRGRGVATKDQSKLLTVNLGAEGSVFAIALLDIFLYPKVTTYFALMLRVPVMWGVIILGNDMLKVLEGKKNNIYSNLLGGAVVAAMAWARIRKGRFHY
ncbi:unnamed protein product [Arabis nemorensis]|uniref:Peptidase S54 rhomboid domain-containing protein n=1 Tax=Arabis nemorensis TaxID=586526 RepID=A0A565B0P5_9BRAS|nr:unnamed protein product [Arabis nemorensis]